MKVYSMLASINTYIWVSEGNIVIKFSMPYLVVVGTDIMKWEDLEQDIWFAWVFQTWWVGANLQV